MLPLDQNKHRSNSGTIQSSKSFIFREWAYSMWKMSRCTKHVLSKDVCHANQLLSWIARWRGMPYEWGCINTDLRNPICSTHSLACKTFSHLMAWWIYRQVDLRCLHSQCKCPLFCWWSLMKWWWTSMCFVLACLTGLLVNLIALSLSHSNGTCLIWFQSHSK